jgi:hypothetical protein
MNALALTGVLGGAGAAICLLWAWSLRRSPSGRCLWCRGAGRIRGVGPIREPLGHGPAGLCLNCRGTGSIQRLGARAVGRLTRRVAGHDRQLAGDDRQLAADDTGRVNSRGGPG